MKSTYQTPWMNVLNEEPDMNWNNGGLSGGEDGGGWGWGEVENG